MPHQVVLQRAALADLQGYYQYGGVELEVQCRQMAEPLQSRIGIIDATPGTLLHRERSKPIELGITRFSFWQATLRISSCVFD